MAQLTLEAASSFTASAAFVLRGSTVTAVAGQAYAVRMGGALVDSLFEVSGNTVTGSATGAAVAFDASGIPTTTPHYTEHGTNSVINVTGNAMRVGATSGSYATGAFVLGFNAVAAPATSPLSYLRAGTLLALAANTFTAGASASGTASDVPLVYCRSYGALVTHDGANSGAGGSLDFLTGGPSTSTAVLGPQLVLRNYAATKSITVAFAVPVTTPSLVAEGCVTQTMAVTNQHAISGGSFMISGGTVSTKLTIGGLGPLQSNSRTVVRVTSVIPTLEVTYSRVSASVVEINGCTTGGLTFSFPIEQGAVVMVRDSMMQSSGLTFSGAISTASNLHVEGNTITHATSDAVKIGSPVTGLSSVLFVGNKLYAATLVNANGLNIAGAVSSGNVVIAGNTGYRGGPYLSGSFTTADASLTITGNTFSPSTSSSNYIFYLPNWGHGARFFHDSSNRYTGTPRLFEFRFATPLGTSTSHDYFVYLSLSASSFSEVQIQHPSMTDMVRNNYQGSLITLDGVTVSKTLMIVPQYAERLSYVLNGVAVTGDLSLQPLDSDAVNIHVKGSTSMTGALVISPRSATNCMLMVESTTASNGISVGGSMSSGTSLVLQSIAIPNERRILFSIDSSCTKASSCLIALWGITLKGVLSSGRSIVRFGGSIGAYTHIDIFQCVFEALGSDGDIHTLEFTSGNPLSTASLSIVETRSIAYNTWIPKANCYSLKMPSTAMTGGIELFSSYFDGDGLNVQWTSSAMRFIQVFNTYTFQQSSGGAATSLSTSVQSCNSGKGVSVDKALTCPSTVARCDIESNFARAKYSIATNTVKPGSCIILPNIAGTITSASFAPVLPSVAVVGTTHTHAQITSGAVSAAVTAFTCGARRDRLSSLRSLFTYPTTSAGVMFASVATCGGVPPASFVSTLIFDTPYTNVDSRTPRWCNASSEVSTSESLAPTISADTSASPSDPASASRTITFSLPKSPTPEVSASAPTESGSATVNTSPTRTASAESPSVSISEKSLGPTSSFSLSCPTSSSQSVEASAASGTASPTLHRTGKTSSPSPANSVSRSGSAAAVASASSDYSESVTLSATATSTLRPPLIPIPAPSFEGTPAREVGSAGSGTAVAVAAAAADPFALLQLDAISAVMSMAVCAEGNISSPRGDRPYDFSNNPLHLFLGPANGAADRGALLSAFVVALAISTALITVSYFKWQQALKTACSKQPPPDSDGSAVGNRSDRRGAPLQESMGISAAHLEEYTEGTQEAVGSRHDGEGRDDSDFLPPNEEPLLSNGPLNHPPQAKAVRRRPVRFSLFQFPSIAVMPFSFVLRLVIWSSVRLLTFSDDGADAAIATVALAAAASYVAVMFLSTTLFFPPNDLVRTFPVPARPALRGWQRALDRWVGPRTSWEVVSAAAVEKESSEWTDDFSGGDYAGGKGSSRTHANNNNTNMKTFPNDDTAQAEEEETAGGDSPIPGGGVVETTVGGSDTSTCNPTRNVGGDEALLAAGRNSGSIVRLPHLRPRGDSTREGAIMWLSRYMHFIERLRCCPWFFGAQISYTILMRALAAAATRSSCSARAAVALVLVVTYLVALVRLRPLAARAKMQIAIVSQSILSICSLLNFANSLSETQALVEAVVYLSLVNLAVSAAETALTIVRIVLVREGAAVVSDRMATNFVEGFSRPNPSASSLAPSMDYSDGYEHGGHHFAEEEEVGGTELLCLPVRVSSESILDVSAGDAESLSSEEEEVEEMDVNGRGGEEWDADDFVNGSTSVEADLGGSISSISSAGVDDAAADRSAQGPQLTTDKRDEQTHRYAHSRADRDSPALGYYDDFAGDCDSFVCSSFADRREALRDIHKFAITSASTSSFGNFVALRTRRNGDGFAAAAAEPDSATLLRNNSSFVPIVGGGLNLGDEDAAAGGGKAKPKRGWGIVRDRVGGGFFKDGLDRLSTTGGTPSMTATATPRTSPPLRGSYDNNNTPHTTNYTAANAPLSARGTPSLLRSRSSAASSAAFNEGYAPFKPPPLVLPPSATAAQTQSEADFTFGDL